MNVTNLAVLLSVMEDMLMEKEHIEQEESNLKTVVVDIKDTTVHISKKIIDTRKRGFIKELYINSPSPDISIYIQIDYDMKVEKTLTDLINVSQYIDWISAFQDEDNYILNIRNLSWSSQALIEIRSSEPIKINRIIATYCIE